MSIERVFEKDIKPNDKNTALYEIKLDKYSDKKVNISFGVESPSGDQTADWVAFNNIFLTN